MRPASVQARGGTSEVRSGGTVRPVSSFTFTEALRAGAGRSATRAPAHSASRRLVSAGLGSFSPSASEQAALEALVPSLFGSPDAPSPASADDGAADARWAEPRTPAPEDSRDSAAPPRALQRNGSKGSSHVRRLAQLAKDSRLDARAAAPAAPGAPDPAQGLWALLLGRGSEPRPGGALPLLWGAPASPSALRTLPRVLAARPACAADAAALAASPLFVADFAATWGPEPYLALLEAMAAHALVFGDALRAESLGVSRHRLRRSLSAPRAAAHPRAAALRALMARARAGAGAARSGGSVLRGGRGALAPPGHRRRGGRAGCGVRGGLRAHCGAAARGAGGRLRRGGCRVRRSPLGHACRALLGEVRALVTEVEGALAGPGAGAPPARTRRARAALAEFVARGGAECLSRPWRARLLATAEPDRAPRDSHPSPRCAAGAAAGRADSASLAAHESERAAQAEWLVAVRARLCLPAGSAHAAALAAVAQRLAGGHAVTRLCGRAAGAGVSSVLAALALRLGEERAAHGRSAADVVAFFRRPWHSEAPPPPSY
jgi:hypothetical protein